MASIKSQCVSWALVCSTLVALCGEAAATNMGSAPSAEREARQKIEKINIGVLELYETSADYGTVSPEVLINGRSVTGLGEGSFKMPWGSPIRVSPLSMFAKDDAFLIEYEAGLRAEILCAELKTIQAAFSGIRWGERVLKSLDGGSKWSCEGVKPGAKVLLLGLLKNDYKNKKSKNEQTK